MSRAEAIWLATDPMDMRAGLDTALARVIQVFGDAKPTMPTCLSTSAVTV